MSRDFAPRNTTAGNEHLPPRFLSPEGGGGVDKRLISLAIISKARRPTIQPPPDLAMRRLYRHWRSLEMSEAGFAAYLGVTRQTIFRNWFRDGIRPNARNAALVLARTGIDIRPPRRRRRGSTQ